MDKDEALNAFISITNAEINVAQSLLEACNYEMDQAVDLYFNVHGGGTFGGAMGGNETTAAALGAGEPSAMEVEEDADMEETDAAINRGGLLTAQLGQGRAAATDRGDGSIQVGGNGNR